MKVYLFYRSNSEDEKAIRELVRLVERDKDAELLGMDLNTREGAVKAEQYDIMQFPSVLATDDEGRLIQLWHGLIPLMNELNYYLHQN